MLERVLTHPILGLVFMIVGGIMFYRTMKLFFFDKEAYNSSVKLANPGFVLFFLGFLIVIDYFLKK